MIRAQVKSGAGMCCDWLGWRTDRFVTLVLYIYIYYISSLKAFTVEKLSDHRQIT